MWSICTGVDSYLTIYGKYVQCFMVVLGVCAIVTITIMTSFYKLTENSPWFNKVGSFEKTEAGYLLTLGKTYQFKDVKRLCAWKSDLYGTKLWFLLIESEKKIKVMSKPLIDEQTFESVDLYKIYHQILKDNPDLKSERNADGTALPYFYLNKGWFIKLIFFEPKKVEKS